MCASHVEEAALQRARGVSFPDDHGIVAAPSPPPPTPVYHTQHTQK